jgi:hypothetical protein
MPARSPAADQPPPWVGDLTGLGVLLDLPVGRLHYRGRRLLGPIVEFHAAVDLLACDTVPERYAAKVLAGRFPSPAGIGARAAATPPVGVAPPASGLPGCPPPAAPAGGQLPLAGIPAPQDTPTVGRRAGARRSRHAPG